ncbi:GAF sensor signal transduction histidine kinase [Hyella patelloides LEGE 07179]|uniref:histidine kinase n=1 Tax=Hyella patelloides LEGE 07179 TaxID=945734 RepID=A0A563VKH9_9CYAN|nr:response regulator [Hyella patelloides]VEP11922.1 GAF sensor signal transduction histidine kinase [Hyella patelloides LEGE 07179]
MNLKAADFKTVLVVDDTPSNLQVLFAYLENAGFTVLLAQNGKRALKIINSLTDEGGYPQVLLSQDEKRMTPDLILLDILMPDINGFEICRQLKSQKFTREIPIIFLTALSETTHKIEGFAVGGVDYITKPIDRQEVIARIKTHLTLRDVRQHLLDRNQELQAEICSRQQVETKLQQALGSEASIRRITERIRDSLNEQQVLETITHELIRVLALNGCQIEFYNKDRECTLSAVRAEPQQSQNRQGSIIVNEQGRIINSTEGIFRQIADFDRIYRQLVQKISLQFVTQITQKDSANEQRTCLVCPIFDNQEPINIMGSLWLFRPPEEIFNPWEIKLVEQIANQCAIAIRQARLYQTSQIQVKELAKLNRLKDDFLKTISHELRSPMSRIQLAVQTLEKLLLTEYPQPRSAVFQRVLTIFRQSCNRQNQLIDDLLTLCHLDAQAETLVMDWIDLQTWIPEIIKPFQERAETQQQQLMIEIASDLPSWKGDPFILERIVQELINNACKYTPAQETILIKATATEKTINLSIRNSGIEIPPEEQKRIFERFYRVPNNDPWQHGGTGLGLYLVKRLLELIQGTITVESRPDVTLFLIELPRVFQ